MLLWWSACLQTLITFTIMITFIQSSAPITTNATNLREENMVSNIIYHTRHVLSEGWNNVRDGWKMDKVYFSKISAFTEKSQEKKILGKAKFNIKVNKFRNSFFLVNGSLEDLTGPLKVQSCKSKKHW